MSYTNPLAHIKLDGTTMDIRDAQADAGITSLNSNFTAFQTATNTTLANHAEQINAIAANQWVSVLDYGADKTGTTDSATAFRNALAATPVHGTMYIPAGTYYIGSTIDIKKPVTICGDYVGLDVEAESTAATADQYKQALINSYCSNSPTFEIYGCGVKLANIGIWQKVANNSRMISIRAGSGSETVPRNICISNVWLNGNAGDSYAAYGIGTNNCNLITSTFEFVRIVFVQSGFAIGVSNAATTSLLFSNCWVQAYTAYAYNLNHAYYCAFYTCAADGASWSIPPAGYALNDSHGIGYYSCGCEKARAGMQFNTSDGIVVSGMAFTAINTAGSSTQACIRFGGTTQATMIGCNVLNGESTALLYCTSSADYNIIGCTYKAINLDGTIVTKSNDNKIHGIN